MDIILHKISQMKVEQRVVDGYINATALTKAYWQGTKKRKDVHNWLNNKATTEIMEHLSSVTGIPVTELVQVIQGGDVEKQGTYIHPKLAVRFAMWLSVEFSYLVEEWVEKWVTGKAIDPEYENRIQRLEARVSGLEKSSTKSVDPKLPPPGWKQEDWDKLPPQDKKHFRQLHRKRNFVPGDSLFNKLLPAAELSAEVRELQRQEVAKLVVPVSQEKLDKIAEAKRKAMELLDDNMPF